ncbi:putative amidoligase enzyme-domain-containing protein [Triangularia verruculosa]|uniref:Amidoligase enzyme-domain-containing protein n=1 Tax=Triangularia verruculosa TaxID=2587418 RepID=A0AAN6XCL6_9PEZI|nr:putative amidoligase enzyme-domain-containing protein [Triangularia verruculosa]
MDSPVEPPTLHFGLEIELLLGPRKKGASHSSWKSLAKDLSKRLAKAGIPNHINDSNDKSPHNYREWSITQEVTIPSQPGKNIWGIELVSPVLSPLSTNFSATLTTIFSLLHTHYAVLTSPHCSTHIHLSQSYPSPFTPLDLASLAKSCLWFEASLDRLFPSRGEGYWCQSNRLNPALAGLSLGECIAVIDSIYTETGHADRVVEAMNLFPKESAYARAHGWKKDRVRGKVYKWDFTGMLSTPSNKGEQQPRGTIEFRQPPGSVVAAEAEAYVILALAFTVGALAYGQGLCAESVGYNEHGGSMEELWDLLVAGGSVLGWDGLGEVEGLFARAV